MTNNTVLELISGLKSRHTETRHKSIRELLHFVKTDLREMTQEAATQVLDEINQQIHLLTSSYDNNDKKAGILIIGMQFLYLVCVVWRNLFLYLLFYICIFSMLSKWRF